MAEQRLDTDIAIIGGGGAGVAAALEAHDAGARAVVLEQDDALGGTAATSGGGCFIVGTPLQEAEGIHDTPDLAFEDWVKWGQGTADELWARYYIEHTLHDLYFWAEKPGAKWMDLKFQEGNRVRRWHRPDGNGFGLMKALVRSMLSRAAARVLTGTRADGLLTQDGRVIGVRAVHTTSGAVTEVRSKTVVVATGGFNSNLEMVLEAKPELRGRRIMEGSGRGATGSGHALVRDLGGYLTHMNRHFEPIAGLYAAGEVAGMAGGHINGKAGLEGTMLGPAIFSGRVAGGWAAHEAGFGPGFVGRANRIG